MENSLYDEKFIVEIQHELFKYANTILRSKEDAEDASMEALSIYMGKYCHHTNKLKRKNLLIVITKHCCFKIIESTKRLRQLEENDLFEDNMFRIVECNMIKQSVHKLRERDKKIVLWYYYHGFSLLEIAKKLDVNPNNIYFFHQEALKNLKEIICMKIKSEKNKKLTMKTHS